MGRMVFGGCLSMARQSLGGEAVAAASVAAYVAVGVGLEHVGRREVGRERLDVRGGEDGEARALARPQLSTEGPDKGERRVPVAGFGVWVVWSGGLGAWVSAGGLECGCRSGWSGAVSGGASGGCGRGGVLGERALGGHGVATVLVAAQLGGDELQQPPHQQRGDDGVRRVGRGAAARERRLLRRGGLARVST